MKILVDADSCPAAVREIIIRSAKRLRVKAIFAANRIIPGIGGPETVMEICDTAEGAADKRIVELAAAGDIVISRDIPLAKKLVDAGVAVINDRGREYSRENIGEMFSLRNFAVGLADNGIEIERTASYGKKETQKFAAALDRILTKLAKLSFPDTDSASV